MPIEPMIPTLAQPFHRAGWVYEEKYDGWRMLAYKNGATVRLISRQGVDHTARFAELAATVAALKAPTLVLDGEVVRVRRGPRQPVSSARSRIREAVHAAGVHGLRLPPCPRPGRARPGAPPTS